MTAKTSSTPPLTQPHPGLRRLAAGLPGSHTAHVTARFVARFSALAALVVVSATAVALVDLRGAETNLLAGRADQAISALRSSLGQSPNNANAHLLLCRTYLSELHGTEAADQCRAALSSGLATSSAAQDWSGRAFGMQAEHAGPIAGLKLAGQVRNAFQTAYHLDPRNPAAANDLGEFYIAAPFLVGGGVDKASSLASEVQPALPEIAHRLRALIAEKAGDQAVAEREFIAATDVAHTSGSFVDLACYYVRQHQAAKGLSAARRAIEQDRDLDANVVDAASTLNDVGQTGQAIQVLRSYLDHGRQSDQAPAFRAHTMLGEFLAKGGNTAAARAEFQAALALASDYAPARKGMASL